MAKRIVDNSRALDSPQNTRAVTCVEPTLDRTGEALVILLLGLSTPRLGMKSQPRRALIFPLRSQMSGDGISQSKRYKIDCTFLLPMRNEVFRASNLRIWIEEA